MFMRNIWKAIGIKSIPGLSKLRDQVSNKCGSNGNPRATMWFCGRPLFCQLAKCLNVKVIQNESSIIRHLGENYAVALSDNKLNINKLNKGLGAKFEIFFIFEFQNLTFG